ncbi:MAG: FAD/NAD(P)-binding protein [Anaerolineales bacterium]|nr:FAD/NAD(P)-binding protein [Anaerolineales bacterium]
MSNEFGKPSMIPYLAKIVSIENLAPEIKLFAVEILEGQKLDPMEFKPGQFAFISAFGVGEAPFGIAALPKDNKKLEFAVQRLGTVTTELHELDSGDVIGIRGPLGNHFPLEDFLGKDILVLGGGIGGAPLRPVIEYILQKREDYGRLTILWAARSPDLLLFKEDYEKWRQSPNTELHITVDIGTEDWDGRVGLITDLLTDISPDSENAVAITCGPPIMIFYADKVLDHLGFLPEQRYVTLEARMHCGIGKCGRCNLGDILVCVDGPVFSMDQVGTLLEPFH